MGGRKMREAKEKAVEAGVFGKSRCVSEGEG